MASRGPDLCSHDFEILNVALLRLRSQNRCGLDPNPNILFLNGHRKDELNLEAIMA
jgi:hypothetical protein